MPTSHTVSDFLELSAALTGFERIELEGTGLTETYYNELNRIVGGRIFGRLLLRWHKVHDAYGDTRGLNPQIRKQILNDPMLGPIARNIITLWYVGNWTQLPRAWRDEFGATAGDLDHVVSAAAFREGLVWRAIEAHPPTAKSPGFGTWHFPPDGAEPLDDGDIAFEIASDTVAVALGKSPKKGGRSAKKKATRKRSKKK